MIVFAARYIDLFVHFIGLYITFMKLAYLGSTAYIIYLMNYRRPYSTTYIRENDNFDYVKYLIPPCAVLSLVFTAEYSIMEILWTFSIILEAVSYIPQLSMLRRMREVESLTANYVFFLGGYRLVYIFNWIYKIANSMNVSYVAIIAGIV